MSNEEKKWLSRIEAKLDLLLAQKATGRAVKLESVSTHSNTSSLSEKEIGELRDRRRRIALKNQL